MLKSFRHTKAACYTGYVTQAIVNNFVPLLFLIFRESFGVSFSQLTVLIAANFVIQLAVDLIAAKFVDKIGYRPCIAAAHLFAAAGIGGIGILPFLLPSPFAGLVVCVVLYAVGGGLIEVLVSPIVEACPAENKASQMSILHSFYCWGSAFVILVSALFLRAAGEYSWRILSYIWAAVPLLNAVYFCFVPIARLNEGGESATFGQLFRMKPFWLFVLLIMAAGAAELSMSQWASAFAESGLGVSKTVGDLAGPCLFAVLMGTARVLHAKLSAKLPLKACLLGSGVLCMASYLLAALSPLPALSLAGCALCGFSVGVMWPGTFSMAAEKIPTGGTALFGLLALSGDLGCTLGPSLVGYASDALGGDLKTGLLFAVAFPVLLVLALALYCPKNPNKKDKSKGNLFD